MSEKEGDITKTKRRAKAEGRTFGDEVDGEEGRERIAEKRGKANKGRTVARL